MPAEHAILTGALTAALRLSGTWLANSAQSQRGRPKGRDRAIASWFDTFELTSEAESQLFFPEEIDQDSVRSWLYSHEAQAALHELITTRITDAPASTYGYIRHNLFYSCIAAFPDLDIELTETISDRVFLEVDHQLKELVGRLEKLNPRFRETVREEAFAGRHAALLESIARHTEILAETSPSNIKKELEFLARYRRVVVREHGSLEPPDFEQRRRIPIHEIYVTPKIAISFPDGLGSAEDIDVWEFGKRLDRSVLLGDPGGGKSTASNALIHRFASNNKARVPLLVILREYAREDPPNLSILGYLENRLETHYQCKPPKGLIERLLSSGKAVLFFDGLDELVDTHRRREVTRRVENFCDQYPHTPVLVTSRRVGYTQAKLDDKQFRTYQLAGFNVHQTKEYALKWFKQERRLSDKEPDAWASAFIRESSRIPDLRSNPLTLALLCLLYRGEDSLPRNRPAVYERCATLLFEKWDTSRGIHSNLKARDLIEPVLRHLAHWLLTRGSAESAVTEEQLVTETTDYLRDRRFEDVDEAISAAREFVSFSRGRAWVFNEVGSTADGEALFTFTHRTFLEYFAARHIASVNDTPEQLARALSPRIVREEWDVVAQLAVQSKDRNTQDGAARFYEALLRTRRYSAVESVTNLLGFLCRGLSFLDLPPRIVRELADRSFEQLLLRPDDPGGIIPLGCLMAQGGRNLEIVKEQYDHFIRQAVESADEEKRVSALELLCSKTFPIRAVSRLNDITDDSVIDYWREPIDSILEEFKDEVISASHSKLSLTYWSFKQGWIPLADAITVTGGFWELMYADFPVGVGGASYIDLASQLVGNCTRVQPNQEPFPQSQLEQIASYVREELGPPPWRCEFITLSSWWFATPSSKKRINALSESGRTGLYFLMAMSAEMAERSRGGRSPRDFTNAGPFAQYWQRRTRQKDSQGVLVFQDLPLLGVASWLQNALFQWSERQIDLIQAGPASSYSQQGR